MFVVYRPFRKTVLLTWRRHHFRPIHARPSWALNSEFSFMCQIYCGTGPRFFMVSSEGSVNCRAFGNCTIYVYSPLSSRMGFEYPTFRIRGERFKHLHNRIDAIYFWQVIEWRSQSICSEIDFDFLIVFIYMYYILHRLSRNLKE